jgi:hypothetical protein
MLLLLQPLGANQKNARRWSCLFSSTLSQNTHTLSLCISCFEDLGITVPITPPPGLIDFEIYAHGWELLFPLQSDAAALTKIPRTKDRWWWCRSSGVNTPSSTISSSSDKNPIIVLLQQEEGCSWPLAAKHLSAS